MRWLAVAGIVVATTSPALAKTPLDPDTGELVPTRVRVALARDVARFTVRLQFDVDGMNGDGNLFRVGLPGLGVVTAATIRIGSHVQRLALESKTKVDKRLEDLMAHPARGHERTQGIRVEADGRALVIDVVADHTASATLDLTIDAPTCFLDDARHVTVPAAWSSSVRTLAPPDAVISKLVEACSGGLESWVSLPTSERSRTPLGESRVGAHAGRLPLRDDAHFARLELALGTLSKLPDDLHTVIVVDHSVSMRAEERESQRTIAAAYLRAAPRSRVQVVGYARTATPLLAGWTVAGAAASRVDSAIRNLPPRNGSNIDDALAAAGTWLARIKGTRRVILFTDARYAKRLEANPAGLRVVLPADTIVHVVTPSVGGTGAITRADEAVLAPLALTSGGMYVDGGVDKDGKIDVTGLTRPISLDNVKISGAGWQESRVGEGPACGDGETASIVEGSSCVHWAEGSRTAEALEITGHIWGRPFKRVVKPDASEKRQVARTLLGLGDIAAKDLEDIERIARTVSSSWSLFAIWGPPGGYDFVTGRFGSISTHSISSRPGPTIGTGTVGFSTNLPVLVRPQLAAAVAGCKPRGKVTLSIELTLAEIVGVDVSLQGNGGQNDSQLASCITEAAWNTFLTLPVPVHHANVKLEY
jgi:hypothetical protein